MTLMPKDFDSISSNEINPVLLKFCFLSLMKTSNLEFIPSSTSLHPIEIGGLHMVQTRYSEDGMQAVFESSLLCLISSRDAGLLFKLFCHAHCLPNPIPTQPYRSVHLSVSATLRRLCSGSFTTTADRIRKIVSQWVNKCPVGTLRGHFTEQRGFSEHAEDPRTISILGTEAMGLHTVSMDLFTDLKIKYHAKSRGKSHHFISLLIGGDVATSLIAIIVLDVSTMKHISQGLQTLAMRYRNTACL